MLIYVFSVFDDFLIKEIKYTSERHKMIKMKWTKAVRSWQDCNTYTEDYSIFESCLLDIMFYFTDDNLYD